MREWEAITKARSKARPKAKLSPDQIKALAADVAAGLSYYAAGKKHGVGGASARYHWLRAQKDQK